MTCTFEGDIFFKRIFYFFFIIMLYCEFFCLLRNIIICNNTKLCLNVIFHSKLNGVGTTIDTCINAIVLHKYRYYYIIIVWAFSIWDFAS